MEAQVLKTEALCWLRFTKKMELVCTEAGAWNADVLGVGDKFSIEVEVKVSKTDLKREFESKRAKHYLYNEGAKTKGYRARHVPNYFYFYVPFFLEEEALKLIEAHSPRAGLAVYGQSTDGLRDGKRTYIRKRPKQLHDGVPSTSLKRAVTLRMGSELCARYIAYRDITKTLGDAIHQLDGRIVDTIKAISWTHDWIEDDANSKTCEEDQASPGPDPV